MKPVRADRDTRWVQADKPASVKHIAHEGGGCSCPRSVDDVRNYSRNAGCYRICDDRSRRRPGEYLDLTRGVEENVAEHFKSNQSRQSKGEYEDMGGK